MTSLNGNKQEPCLIRPFQSRISKRPVMPGFQVAAGEWSKPLDDMGYANWKDEEKTKERRVAFQQQLNWSIAHRNYSALRPCISITDFYNEATQHLSYEIDLYGDGEYAHKGQLYINRGEYLMFYMRMAKHRRKEAILDRIALANIHVLVPYVWLDSVTFDKSCSKVEVDYRIVI